MVPDCETASVLYQSSTAWKKHEVGHTLRLSSFSHCPFCGIEGLGASEEACFRHVAKHLQEVSLAALPQMVGRDNDANSDSSRSAGEHGEPSIVISGDAVSESGESSVVSSWGSSDNDVGEEAEEGERNQVTKVQPQKTAEGSPGHNPSNSGNLFIFRAGNDAFGDPTTISGTGGFENNLPFQFHSQNPPETTFSGLSSSHLNRDENLFQDPWPQYPWPRAPNPTHSLQQAPGSTTAEDFPQTVANMTINTHDDNQGSSQKAK